MFSPDSEIAIWQGLAVAGFVLFLLMTWAHSCAKSQADDADNDALEAEQEAREALALRDDARADWLELHSVLVQTEAERDQAFATSQATAQTVRVQQRVIGVMLRRICELALPDGRELCAGEVQFYIERGAKASEN